VVADALADLGGEASVPDLVKAAKRRAGPRLSRSAVERALDGGARFVRDGTDPRRPRWSLAPPDGDRGTSDAAPAAGTRDGTATRAALDALALRDWQVEAFAAWSAAG